MIQAIGHFHPHQVHGGLQRECVESVLPFGFHQPLAVSLMPAVAKCHRVTDLHFFAAVGKMNVVSPVNVVVVLVVVDIGVAMVVLLLWLLLLLIPASY